MSNQGMYTYFSAIKTKSSLEILKYFFAHCQK